MNTIVMTGETGVGKSRVVEALGMGRRVMLIDPLSNKQWSVPADLDLVLSNGQLQWSAPAGPADLVVFDHLSSLSDAADQLRQATAWCEAHQVNLLLVVQIQEDLDSLGISIPSDATVSLSRPPQAETLSVSIRYQGETTYWNATFDTCLSVADSNAFKRLLRNTTNRRNRKGIMNASRATSRTRRCEVMRDAMVFASQGDDPRAFLQAWLKGDWPRLRQEWPEYDLPLDLATGELGSESQDIVEEAFVAGLTAFELGMQASANPFQDNSVDHHAWSSG